MVLLPLFWWINFSRMARRMFEDLEISFAGEPRQGTMKYIGGDKTIIGADTLRRWGRGNRTSQWRMSGAAETQQRTKLSQANGHAEDKICKSLET